MRKDISTGGGGRGGRTYIPKITYSFSILGSSCEREISLGWRFTKSGAEDALDEIGPTINVRYNPGNPNEHIPDEEKVRVGTLWESIAYIAIFLFALYSLSGFISNTLTISKHATEAEAHFNKGGDFYDQNDYENAIKEYNQAIQLAPSFPGSYNNRGITYYAMGELDKAIQDYTQAIQLDPETASHYSNRGMAYVDKRDYKNAIYDYNKAIELDPKVADYYLLRAYYFELQNDHENAMADYREAIALNPNDPQLYLNHAMYEFSKGYFKEAIDDYTRVIALDPTNADTYLKRASVYYLVSDNLNAKADLQKALEINQDPQFRLKVEKQMEVFGLK